MFDSLDLQDNLLIEPSCERPDPALAPHLERYLVGDCHILAVALHRQMGWQMAVVLNEDAWFWEDPRDPDNGIPEVVHVYAIDPQGRAWDIRGARPEDTLVADCADHFLMDASGLSVDWVKGEIDLEPYVGEGVDEDGQGFDRPLAAYTDQDVARALDDARAHLAAHPHWPRPSRPVPRGM